MWRIDKIKHQTSPLDGKHIIVHAKTAKGIYTIRSDKDSHIALYEPDTNKGVAESQIQVEQYLLDSDFGWGRRLYLKEGDHISGHNLRDNSYMKDQYPVLAIEQELVKTPETLAAEVTGQLAEQFGRVVW